MMDRKRMVLFSAAALPFLTPPSVAAQGSPEGPALWENHLAMSRKVIDPLWEARDELEITLDLACRMGMEKDFWGGRYDTMINDFVAPIGITLDQLEGHALKGIYLPRTKWMDRRERFDELFKDLPNGKIQLANRILKEEGFEPFPAYRGEPEDPLNAPELAEAYPLMFTDEHSDYINHHSWMRDIPCLRELKKHAVVKIHPATAEKYCVGNGDWIGIVSPHGKMKAVALLIHSIRPDTVMAQHGWWQGCGSLDIPETSPLEGGTNPNVLYDRDHMDPLTGDITKNTLVRIEKANPPKRTAPIKEGI
jgi:anaerobic selenocysteine-containing dehydrogenase